jgi:hypothetical protein
MKYISNMDGKKKDKKAIQNFLWNRKKLKSFIRKESKISSSSAIKDFQTKPLKDQML